MNRKLLYSILAIISISFLGQVVAGYIRFLLGIEYSTIVSFFYYVFFYLYARKKYVKLHKSVILSFILLPILILNLFIRLPSLQGSLGSLPESIVHILIVIILWISTCLKTSFKRNVLLSLTALLIIIFSFSFYKYWNNYVNYASFTGSVNEKNLTKIEGLDNMREIVNVRHQTDLIVLDFWHTSCGICFRKFPVLQKLSNKYLHSQKVRVLAINIPLKSDTNQMAFNMLFSNSYTFENIIAIDSSLYKKFNVNVFPTTLLLDKHDNVLFRGDIEDVDNKIINLLKN